MKRTSPKKLTLSRESLHRLERQDLAQAAAAGNSAKCTDISCHFGCGNYTRFQTCTI